MKHDIEVRKIPFEFSDDIPAVWHPDKREWSHMVNGSSLSMPYLEPFLIKTLREAVPMIADADLQEDARGFIAQEAQHFTNHRRYNERLKQDYPELAEVEASMTRDYERFAKRSLDWRLAYSAGFESMTIGVTDWLINDRRALFEGADPTVTSLILWHMVEETEHKTVAFDVYQAVCGRYWLRALGLVQGSFHVGFLARRGYRAMLKRDGRWWQPRSRLKLWWMVLRFFAKVAPAMLRALKPGHHPTDQSDPPWVDAWRAAYSARDDDRMPLLDTGPGGLKAEFGGA